MSLGARNNFVPVTTASIGREIGRSQQSASKHLMELEQTGMIKRVMGSRGMAVKITPDGYMHLARISKTLQSSLGPARSYVKLEGTLVSGMGEGAYYMSLPEYTKQFRERLGYVPFPGTLNIKMDGAEFAESARQLDALDGIKIAGFHDGTRTFGWVKCFQATANDLPCHLIRLERTHHEPSIIELVSANNIRASAGLDDGARVVVLVPVSS